MLAANGLEGMLRPVLQQATGPAVAGLLIGAFFPAVVLQGIVACHLIAFFTMLRLSKQIDAADPALEPPLPSSVWADLAEGVRFTIKTPWLFATLLWAVCIVFLFVGPFEVLTPFIMRDELGLGAESFGLLLAIFGAGSAIGSLFMASVSLPRRYLSVMVAAWGFTMAPLAWFGFASHFWELAVIGFIVGAGGGIGQVIWGTLLQRRVPLRMLGRISSLDFFVSLALMPISMALAGPLSTVVDNNVIFLVIGIATPVISVIAWLAARMWEDEIAHPLDTAVA
ncbi:MFS transporter [Humidisolicoccus flavus]